MRLLINAIPLLGEPSGIGNYTRHIANHILATTPDWELTFFYGYLSKKLREMPKPGNHSWLGNLKLLAKKGTLPRRIAKKALQIGNLCAQMVNPKTWDCYFEPNFVTLPNLAARTTVIAVHDFSCFRFPQWHPVERVRYMEKYFWRSVENATHLVTVSHAIRTEAIETYGIPAHKITAIPNGVDHGFYYPRNDEEVASLKNRYQLPPSYVLYVGAIEPRKNLVNLVHAHSQLPANLRKQYPLLLVGSQGWHNEDLLSLLHKQREYVRILGYVPNADLPAFYTAATLFAYPSWYEGYGLPVAEAMACGRPVLTSNTPALEELCAEAGIYAPPEDVSGMAEKMRELLEDGKLRKNLSQAAINRVKRYSWKLAATSHADLFSTLAARC